MEIEEVFVGQPVRCRYHTDVGKVIRIGFEHAPELIRVDYKSRRYNVYWVDDLTDASPPLKQLARVMGLTLPTVAK